MRLKSTKKNSFNPAKMGKNFTSGNLTCYSGLTAANDYAYSQGLSAQWVIESAKKTKGNF